MDAEGESATIEEYRLPCAEALLAGTLALMTAHAQACCDGHRQLMARKVEANLAQLSEHALLSPVFRAALWNLRSHWCGLACQAPSVPEPMLWHAAPGAVQ